jgi:hypothetical protein
VQPDSSRGRHEGESSFALCGRLSRTRDNSQRQLPTDHDYAVPTREYQTDQSSLNLLRLLPALSSRKSKRNYKKHPHRFRSVDMVTPYQGAKLSGGSVACRDRRSAAGAECRLHRRETNGRSGAPVACGYAVKARRQIECAVLPAFASLPSFAIRTPPVGNRQACHPNGYAR